MFRFRDIAITIAALAQRGNVRGTMPAMGSDLFYGKVDSDRIIQVPLEQQVRDYTDGEFREYLWELGLGEDLDEEPSPAEFLSRVQSGVTLEHLDAMDTAMFFNRKAIQMLDHKRPIDLDPVQVDLGLKTAVVARNLLAAQFPERFEPIQIRRIQVTLAMKHPDACFRDVEDMNGWLLRGFALRVLDEAHKDGFFNGPFGQYFGQFDDESLASASFCDREDDVDSFIWQVRYANRLPMQVDDERFWAKHARRWWAKRLRDYLTAPSDHFPYEVATLEIDTHPRWAGTLNKRVFDSRAY